MRILQIARYGSVKGGAESYVRALSEGLRSAGHEVALAWRFDPDTERPEVRAGRELEAITSRTAEPAAAERAEVRALLRDLAPDIVHVHNVDASWLARECARLAPTVLAVHDHRLDCPTGTRYWAAWKRACDIRPGLVCLGYNVVAHCGSLRANVTLQPYTSWRRQRAAALGLPRLQVFSGAMRDALARAGFDPGRVTVTPYPVPPMPQPAAVPASDRPVIFATGRLVKEKGFDLLLDALDHVPTPVDVVIAGRGHHGAALMTRARAVPARHRVRFAGWLPPAELAGWYAAASVVAVPSAWPEPFGIVGLEAMAAGAPVVATRIGGITEWLEHGVTGLATPPGDAAAFGAAIAGLLADPARARALGESGRARVTERFALPAHVETVLELYARTRDAGAAA